MVCCTTVDIKLRDPALICLTASEPSLHCKSVYMGSPVVKSVRSLFHTFVLATCVHNVAAALSFSNTGLTVTLNDIPYYVSPDAVATLPVRTKLSSLAATAGFVPLTVINTPSVTYSENDLAATLSNFTAADDVFQEGFLEGIAYHLPFPSHRMA